ncbi:MULTISPECIES: hypothetical protein [unclassified Ensifer]|uniref:hypothetical protein n=1 Tax=unclassified Ensifer TaxID=2633371 RepID=UPI00070A889B|nr:MULTISPECIES: hypothetical protein [unclassified Ensifer]KQW62711.1 hypothetical protein ASD02_00840 [Ensifer sp. Root1252]KRC83531.1 hypothetical protein ASE32_00835 [Ensifer sp. Root231]KRC86564.1 hypothetical protein ASE47_16815 [Ensifer sp. Root258]
MHQYQADRMMSCTSFLAVTISLRAYAIRQGANVKMEFDGYADEIDPLLAHLEEMGMRSAAKSLIRLRTALDETISGKHEHDLLNRFQDFKDRLQDELSSHMILALSEGEQLLFKGAEAAFGPDVVAKFPSLKHDLDEAAKCLALARPTASAFHSLRSLEAGIRAISRCLNIPDPTKGADRNWGRMLQKVKQEIEARWPAAADRFAGDGKVFEELHAALAVIQNPYRNATAHLDAVYDQHDATHLMEMTKGLLRRIANRMDEDGHPIA